MSPPTPVLDLSGNLATLAAALVGTVPELGHIDLRRVLFAVSRSRAEGLHGVYARISPLAFAGGAKEWTRQRGRYREIFRLPTLNHQGREIRYVITLLIPRFLRLGFEQKLQTIIHELYHISEACDGDIRRFPGRNFAHGSSRHAYNRQVAAMADRFLAADPDPGLLRALHLGEADWSERRLRITGLTIPLPQAKLVARERW